MSTAFSAPQIWPFPVGTKPALCRTLLFTGQHPFPPVYCDGDLVPGTDKCTRCANTYEPTDAELGNPEPLTSMKGPTK